MQCPLPFPNVVHRYAPLTITWEVSTDGYLFSYDWCLGELTNLGKPNRQSHIRALAEGFDGRIFGLVEEPGGMAHLFSFDPTTRSFSDLGLLGSAFPEYWIAHSLGAMAVGPNGELFIGETDEISHPFIYYPRWRRAGGQWCGPG